MEMYVILLLKLYLFSFLLNFFWEVRHCVLYTTCLKMKLQDVATLLTKMSLKDAFFITLFYVISVFLFQNWQIFTNVPQLVLFLVLCFGFSFIDERISIRMGRWEYDKKMPIVFGVGLTPLLEVGVTGALALLMVFYL